jgi:prepilin-type N-terminal cleavage/methylation domain-containing protein
LRGPKNFQATAQYAGMQSLYGKFPQQKILDLKLAIAYYYGVSLFGFIMKFREDNCPVPAFRIPGMLYSIRNYRGITLIELVIVLVIISVIATIVTISTSFIGTERIQNTSKNILGDLQWLRQSALTQGPDSMAPRLAGFGIRFESASVYHIFRFNDSNRNFSYDGTGEEAALSGEAAIRKIDIQKPIEMKIKKGTTLVDPDNSIVIFDHHGLPRQAQMGFQTMSIIIQNPDDGDSQKKCISIYFNRIREGIWDGKDCQEQ